MVHVPSPLNDDKPIKIYNIANISFHSGVYNKTVHYSDVYKSKKYFRIKLILHNEQIDSIQPYASVVHCSIDIKTDKFCEKFIFNLVQISIRQ